MTAGMKRDRGTTRAWRLALCAALCLPLLSCGDGDNLLDKTPSTTSTGTTTTTTTTTTPAAPNVAALVVDSGPAAVPSPDVNSLFTSVTICVPGSTTNCQTIDHIQVDTGSVGLRILASVLTLSLETKQAANGDSLVECTPFVDGYSWGPVVLADVQISSEIASNVPVQIVGSPSFSSVPANCSGMGPQEDTVATFRANGVLGVGVFAQDCGAYCVSTVDNELYYACTSTQCASTAVPLASQVTNPVTLFATDNNGVIIQLASVAATGAVTVTGSMIFGIDTQSNNTSGSQKVLTVDDLGEFTAVFNGQTYDASFLDTGSNGLFFKDSSIAVCSNSNTSDFYCPTSTLNLSATLQGANSVSTTADFSVANAATLASSDATSLAFSNLAGPYPGTSNSFDFGMPFYYGRSVYTAFADKVSSAGTGPYVAF
jgi:Protein of unknown function (DUF3443)